MAQRNPNLVTSDWVEWWKPSETQVQWQAAWVERKRRQLVAQAEAGGYVKLARLLAPPASEYDVDILDPVPTPEEVEAMRTEAAAPVDPLPLPDGDWSMLNGDDDLEGIELLQWLDKRFPKGWDWLYWLDGTSPTGASFFKLLRSEHSAAADLFCSEEDDSS